MMNEKRVGDCLEYALVDEFFQEMYEDVYIKAVIMYLVIYGYSHIIKMSCTTWICSARNVSESRIDIKYGSI